MPFRLSHAAALVLAFSTLVSAQAPRDPRFPDGQGSPALDPRQPQSQILTPPSAAPQAPAPAARGPFQLTRAEEQQLDVVLLAWQQKQVKQFQATFTRWDYDDAFGPKEKQFLIQEAKGLIKYQSPDRGQFKIEEIKAYNAMKGQYLPTPDGLEEWRCDGKSIFEYDFKNKLLKEHPLPPQLQGQSIIDAPLPFVFGANAVQLKQRYWLRLTTPATDKANTWIEAFPRFRNDAQNYQKVEIILVNATMVPSAIQMYLPSGTSRQVYQFTPQAGGGIRGFFFGEFNFTPKPDNGWKLVKDELPQPQPAQSSNNNARPTLPTDPRSAQQPPAGGLRPALK